MVHTIAPYSFPKLRFVISYYNHAICHFSSTCKNHWDPTISLNLKHPTLVILETCRTGEHFKSILAQTIRHHLIKSTFPMSRLLYFSAIAHPEYLNVAKLLIKHFTPKPNLYIYNVMMSALSFSFKETNSLYRSLLGSCFFPDEHTLLFLMKSSSCLIEGKQIHCHVVVTGFHSHLYLQNSLIKMYSNNNEVDMARQVFEHMCQQDNVTYNCLMSGYARNGHYLEALEVFHRMKLLGIESDQYTLSSLLACCGYLQYFLTGKSIHAWIIRRKSFTEWGLTLSNSLLDMYVKCDELRIARCLFENIEDKDVISWNTMIAGFTSYGDMALAQNCFNQMPGRDLITWNTLLSGYAHTGSSKTVIELFKDMLAENVKPDKVTAIILIGSLSDVGMLNQGRCVHGWLVRNTMKLDAFLASALIDMYCKSGSIEKSLLVWKNVSRRDVPVWTSIIMGLAFHGRCTEAMKMFREMQDEGLKPNKVTLVAILTACSHAGLVNEGCLIFQGMEKKYGIKPGIEHYGCMVDLLTRAERVSEARNLIRMMPFDPGQSIWGAILSASKDQGNVELAIDASKELLKLKPEEEVGYIMLSNVYASGGKWSHSYDIRNIMERKCSKKTAGCSNIVANGVIHDFIASDKKHKKRKEIYSLLGDLSREIKYATETCSIFSSIFLTDIA